MTVYYWHNQGRLGNLLFQYAAILHFTNENDVIVCLDDSVFEAITPARRFVRIPCPRRLRKWTNHAMNLGFDLLARLRLVSSISPRIERFPDGQIHETREVEKTFGLLRKICQIKGYFQHDEWIGQALNFRQERVAAAANSLAAVSSGSCRVGVQIRLGDYQRWAVLGKQGVVLPVDWYNRAINEARARLVAPEFIIFTDDKATVAELELRVPLRVFEGRDAVEDLIALSLCDHAIISPSTYAYCAAIARWHRDKLVIAPKYWAGFKSEVWFPPTIETSRMLYLDSGIPSDKGGA